MTPTPDPDMTRSLTLSLIQAKRDKVPPRAWVAILRMRHVGIDMLGRVDLVVLEEIVRDLDAVIAEAKP